MSKERLLKQEKHAGSYYWRAVHNSHARSIKGDGGRECQLLFFKGSGPLEAGFSSKILKEHIETSLLEANHAVLS